MIFAFRVDDVHLQSANAVLVQAEASASSVDQNVVIFGRDQVKIAVHVHDVEAVAEMRLDLFKRLLDLVPFGACGCVHVGFLVVQGFLQHLARDACACEHLGGRLVRGDDFVHLFREVVCERLRAVGKPHAAFNRVEAEPVRRKQFGVRLGVRFHDVVKRAFKVRLGLNALRLGHVR